VPSKFNVSSDVSKRTYDGIVYDSAVEMKFMRDYLKPKLESGELVSVERQVKYVLQPAFRREDKLVRAINYVADFVITYQDGHVSVIDIKGMADATALLKRKLFWYTFPDVDYQWISYSKTDGGWISYDTLIQKRKERRLERKKRMEHK